MSVAARHKKYKKRLAQWIRQRDVLEGEDQVKAKGPDYLPMLDGQSMFPNSQQITTAVSVTPYEQYRQRASFMNSTSRTRDALVGAIMRKLPDTTWPKEKEKVLNVVQYNGDSFNELAHETLDEVIGVGRMGILVDAPVTKGGRPYCAVYYAENITDWEEAVVNDRKQPIRVTLYETAKRGDKVIDRYRVLRLALPGAALPTGELVADSPTYFQEVWEEVEPAEGKELPAGSEDKEFELITTVVPTLLGGAKLTEIPFEFFNPMSTHADPEKPPLLDLAVVNLSHYRNSADLEHGLHFTALPQPWVAGFNFPGSVVIGSGVVWSAEDPQAQAGYLEFTGQGLGAIRTQMHDKKKEMAALGARLLEEQQPSGSAEAAETVKLRHSGESSVLTRISLNVSNGLGRCLTLLARFLGMVDTEVTVKLNLDFGVDGLESEMIMALMAQVQAGLISHQTYWWNMRRGEMYPEGTTYETEASQIEAGRPEDPMQDLVDDGPSDEGGPGKKAPKKPHAAKTSKAE